MLTGKPPFDDESAGKVMLSQVNVEPEPIQKKISIDDELGCLIMSMLAKDAGGRPQSVEEIIKALDIMI
jgi:serine/threonine protein kinase